MNKYYIICCFLFVCIFPGVNSTWSRQQCGDGDLVSEWGLLIDPYTDAVLPEYPRPQLVRDVPWENLNGLWQFQVYFSAFHSFS